MCQLEVNVINNQSRYKPMEPSSINCVALFSGVCIDMSYDVICLNKSLLTPRQPLKGSTSISGQVAVVSFKLRISVSVSILGAERHHVERWRGTQWEYFKLPPSNYRNRGLEYLNPKFMSPDPQWWVSSCGFFCKEQLTPFSIPILGSYKL